MTTKHNSERYPFTWALAQEEGSGSRVWLGFYGKTRHVAKFTIGDTV